MSSYMDVDAVVYGTGGRSSLLEFSTGDKWSLLGLR